MMTTRLLFAFALAAALSPACNKQPAPAARAPAPRAATAESVNALTGKVAETIDATQYTYLRLQTPGGEVWAAVPKTHKEVGEQVTVLGPIWMENFKSATLNRTWERIAFGTLAGEAPPTSGAAPEKVTGAGMFAAQAAAPAHGTRTGAADVGEIKVAKAGKTIAEIYSAKTRLNNKQVSVRGKVVKATNGVLGKNWLHVRDGTGAGNTADLAVASDGTAAVGETVLVTGTVHLDRDLGAGYHYDVIVEDAKIKVE